MKFPILTNVLTNVWAERGGKVRKKEENICQGKKMKGDEIVDFIAFLSMGYKKDIFGSFAYDFELLQFSVKYRLTPK